MWPRSMVRKTASKLLRSTKIQQTKMLVTWQRFGDLFLFGLIWQYSSNHKTYNKGRFKVIATYLQRYSVSHNFIYPSKELCSKIVLGEVGVSLPRWCHTLVLPAPGYWRLFLNLIIFSEWKNDQFQRNFRSKLKLWKKSNFIR